jgi:energy-coupling factor transport system ATP-binding protein
VLTLEGVGYRYAGARADAISGITLTLQEGRVTGLAGAVAAGKSTVCLVAGGLAPRVVGGRSVGRLLVDGADVAAWPMYRLAEQVVAGLQDPAGQLSLVAPTVEDEVAFGPANLGLERAEIMARTEEAMRLVGVVDLRHRDPARLSGGQQQLVVLAGLMAMRPRHLILDEPVAHLDAAGARQVLSAIRAIAESGTAVLLAEQRTWALEQVCDSLALLAAGNLVEQGDPATILGAEVTASLGVEAPALPRLRRTLMTAGLDPAWLDPADAEPTTGAGA